MKPARDRRGFVVLLAAVIGIALTANLGLWQLRRAAQKIALQTALDSRALLPVLGEADLVGNGVDLERLHYRRVHLQGRWLAEKSVFLENRQMNGRVGFYLVTPLQFVDRREAVLVQRGWVPRDQRDRTLLPPVPTPDGRVDISGVIAPPPARLYEFAPSASGVIRQNLDLVPFALESGLKLLPMSVQELGATSSAGNDGLLREWPRPAVKVDMHYGYAFQWFALSALMAVLYVWFQLLRPWLLRRGRG